MNTACSTDSAHRFRIAHDHACLAGRFPGRPLVPGVEAGIDVRGEPPRSRFGIRTGQTLLARGRVKVEA